MQKQKDELKKRFKTLSSISGVSGCEEEIAREVVKQIKPFADEVHVSSIGNIVAIKKGSKEGLTLAIGAHLDEVGFLVRNVLSDGFLLIDKIGGVSQNIVMGRKVFVGENKIPGVIGSLPEHLLTPEQSEKAPPIEQCFIDVGAQSKEEVNSMGIKIGDGVVMQSDMMEFSNPDFVCGRAVDNRIGCSIIIEMFKELENIDFAGTILGVFTVREEVGLEGAKTALFPYDVDYVITVDTVPVSDTPGFMPETYYPMYLGKGPGFVLFERGGLGNRFQIIHPAIRKIIEASAAKAEITLQTMTFGSASYATDGSSYYVTGKGLPVGNISIPRRYSHSPIEMFHIQDAVDVKNLLTNIVLNNEFAKISFI